MNLSSNQSQISRATFKQSLFNKTRRKHNESQPEMELNNQSLNFKIGHRNQSQPTAPTYHQENTIVSDYNREIQQSDIDSNMETPASSRRTDSVIKEFELQFSPFQSAKQIRPDIALIEQMFQEKYAQQVLDDDEILLFVICFIQISNVCFNYECYTFENRTKDIQFWLGLSIEWISSLYFTYDSIVKLREFDQEFHFNIILHLITGPIQFSIDIAYFIRFQRLYWLAIILKSLKVATTNFQKQHLNDIYSALINCLPMLFTSLVFFFIFAYLFTIFYGVNDAFSNISRTSFTLLQITTLDGWGDITKRLSQNDGNSVIFAMFIFITFIAMFFWFLIQAFQIDVMILDELVKQQKVVVEQAQPQDNVDNLLHLDKESKTLSDILYGRYYNRLIFIIWLLQLIYSDQINIITGREYSFIVFHVLISLIYSIHFLMITILQQNIAETKSSYRLVLMLLHICSGPLAFIVCIYELNSIQHLQYGPIFLFAKILTNSNIRDISYISLTVLTYSLTPYICMLALTLILTVLITTKYDGAADQEYTKSLLQYLQVLTLDDWSGNITEKFIDKHLYFAAAIQIIYMLVAHFVLIPAFLALACEIFQSVLGITFRPRLNNEDFQLNLFTFQGNLEQSDANRLSKLRNLYEQKRILYTLLRFQRAIFAPENYSQPRLLKNLLISLTKQQNQVKQPSTVKITRQERNLIKKLQTIGNKESTLTIITNNQRITINADLLKLGIRE